MPVGFLNLADLLEPPDARATGVTPILPEAAVMRLREAFEASRTPNPFRPGDLVTPRKDSQYTTAGQPHIVLLVDIPRFDLPDEPFADMRVLGIHGDTICPHNVESWQWEVWTQPKTDAERLSSEVNEA